MLRRGRPANTRQMASFLVEERLAVAGLASPPGRVAGRING
jgi:hypothetical protein